MISNKNLKNRALVRHKKHLPNSINDLNKFILLGSAQLKVFRERLNTIKSLDLAQAVYQQTLEDAQRVCEAVLMAKVKMGEFLIGIPHERGKRNDLQPAHLRETKLKSTGIPKKRQEEARKLYQNQDLIEDVTKKAIDKGEIPTTKDVLVKIKEREIEQKARASKIHIPAKNSLPIIQHGDFRELIKKLNTDSIDLVLTDLPYHKEYLPLWSDLSKHSARVLKPGKFLITYA